MAEVIRMPKMSDTMEEGVIAAWLVKEGDTVKSGDILAEVETDKATMELESYEDGVLLHIGAKEQEAVPVDGVIAVIGEKGEDYQALLKEVFGSTKNTDGENQTKESEPDDEASSEPQEEIDTSRINATLITMPKMSDTMEEGVIASWLIKEGDTVKSGDILAEVETDKATMELESYEDGTLLYIGAKEGSSVEVDGVIAVIGSKGENYQLLIDAHKQKTSKSTPTES
jgi:pyruvate dehydrogenase E2 component (dihydrolipoamide acetyltransferase)